MINIIKRFKRLFKKEKTIESISKEQRDSIIKKYVLEAMIESYYLRADVSSEFIIAINKQTGEYENIYRKYIPSCSREEFIETVSKMDKHPKYEN